MWRSLALMFVAGCSFHAHAIDGDAPAGPTVDGRVDAPHDTMMIDAAVDAPPDACSDSDGDGICDSVDDWPCGAKPTAPSTTVTMMGNGTATKMVETQISVNGAQMVVAAPGATIAVAFHYVVTDTACPSACIDQIEIGYVPGSRKGCVFDQTVSKTTGAMGDATTSLTAPMTAGAYDIRTNIGQNTSCGSTTSWWAGTPDDTRTIARLCVH